MDFEGIVKIMSAIRRGCPWDREQTHETLRPYLIEEAYELIEAIDEADPEKIKEELGDLLLQILFHAELGSERGEFDIGDVIDGIGEKMTGRHPHVFSDAHAETPEDVRVHWERQKKKEGKLLGSALEGVPVGLPALLRAKKLQERASRAGFDWPGAAGADGAVQKLDEELGEFKQAVQSGDRKALEDELGDLLFSVVNVSRFFGINPEDSLRKSLGRFSDRFTGMEEMAKAQGKDFSSMGLREMDELWEEVKKSRGSSG